MSSHYKIKLFWNTTGFSKAPPRIEGITNCRSKYLISRLVFAIGIPKLVRFIKSDALIGA